MRIREGDRSLTLLLYVASPFFTGFKVVERIPTEIFVFCLHPGMFADETAQNTFRTADMGSKLGLCDFSGFHQVLFRSRILPGR